MRKLLAWICFFTLLSSNAWAQFQPGGCPGQWVQGGGGSMCLCPDGSYASGFPNMTCGGGMSQPPRQDVTWCSSGSYCQLGQTCCGQQCCNSGYQCSSAGCIPQGAADCGNGQFCNAGTICWRVPEDWGRLRRGQIACGTYDQTTNWEQQIEEQRAQRREAARQRAEEKMAEEDRRREEARRKAVEKKAEAKRAAEKKAAEKAAAVKAAADKAAAKKAEEEKAKQQANVAAQKKVSEILKEDLEKQRRAELERTLKQQASQRELEQLRAGYQAPCAQLRQQAIARGENLATAPGNVFCAAGGFPFLPSGATPPSKVTMPPSLPTAARPFDRGRCQLEQFANGASGQYAQSYCELQYLASMGKMGVASPPIQNPPGTAITAGTQWDHLKQNIGTLQPEQRKIEAGLKAPVAEAPRRPPAASTFICGTPPNQFACPVEVLRRADEVYAKIGIQPQRAILDRLEERHRKGLEYLRENPEVKNALFAIQLKTGAAVVGGPAGLKTAEYMKAVHSVYEINGDFRAGKHYEGSLKAINEVSSLALDKFGPGVGVPVGTSDALNLGGAAATAYLYGFFHGQ